MERCETCHWWRECRFLTDPAGPKRMGLCYSEDITDLAIHIQDFDDLGGGLATDSEFGCVLWKGKGE